jgi:hypothetical protein
VVVVVLEPSAGGVVVVVVLPPLGVVVVVVFLAAGWQPMVKSDAMAKQIKDFFIFFAFQVFRTKRRLFSRSAG